jgi:hypothetical protein
LNADNPRPIIGYPTYDSPIRLIHYDLLPIHNFLAHKILAIYIYIVCAHALKTLTVVMRRASFVTI